MSESKHDESFKVVDRRLFTPEGEFRKEVAEQQDRERKLLPAACGEQRAALRGGCEQPNTGERAGRGALQRFLKRRIRRSGRPRLKI